VALSRMSSALSIAASDRSEPKQFVLSWTDYGSLAESQHQKLSRINGTIYLFDGIRVVKAEHEGAGSILEVWTTQPHAMNHVRV
jgi:hypothetical protein